MIDDGTGYLTIGELARTTGLTVRTIRYWSDEGALPPVTRSSGGYRLYDAYFRGPPRTDPHPA